ncbi:MAG TPA: vitamin K epoxide reductase family protein, partial [Kofleriaceae bacterium]
MGAVLGLVFAGVSTYDFVQHLDRQVHSLHCSFIPGVTHSDPTSGCQLAMMSPYSSIFRTHVWGGIPISLGAMSVFAFIAFAAGDLVLTRRKDDAKATLFLLAAATLPLLVSLVMLTISLTKLGTTCKLCVCIYLSSAMVFTGALMTWRRAKQGATLGMSRSGGHRLEVGVASEPASNGFLAGMFGVGCLFVALPVMLYLASAPDNSKFIGTCDALSKPDDTYGVMVNVHRTSPRNAQALEILDPLCP